LINPRQGRAQLAKVDGIYIPSRNEIRKAAFLVKIPGFFNPFGEIMNSWMYIFHNLETLNKTSGFLKPQMDGIIW